MTKVKVFVSTSAQTLEQDVNRWLEERGSRVKVISLHYSQSSVNFSVLIYYQG